MIKIMLCGCNGRIGRAITDLVHNDDSIEIVAGVDLRKEQKYEYPVFAHAEECNISVDGIIDFSNPESLDDLLEYSKKTKTPLLVATTGHTKIQLDNLYKLSETVPVFKASNVSVGVNLLVELVKHAAKVLEENYDIEIVEKHHNIKKDSPSGTALTIAESIQEVLSQKHELIYGRHGNNTQRTNTEIGIHAVRGGTIVGEHDVIFAGNDETIEIKHSATSKNVFASGALQIIKFLTKQKPGNYTMNDLFKM